MASTSDRKLWEEQAAFMRAAGITHAEWAIDEEGKMRLMKAVLAPSASTPAAPRPQTPASLGPAARLARMHQTQFAASSMRPPLSPAARAADVPRVNHAKKAPKRGASKAPKRSS